VDKDDVLREGNELGRVGAVALDVADAPAVVDPQVAAFAPPKSSMLLRNAESRDRVSRSSALRFKSTPMRRISPGCCARTTLAHGAENAAPAKSESAARRLTDSAVAECRDRTLRSVATRPQPSPSCDAALR
jgi:hypothetical protein